MESASMDVMSLNNLLTSMRPLCRRAKLQVINKLTKKLKFIKNTKGYQDNVNVDVCKFAKTLDEFKSLKSLNVDLISKHALGFTSSFAKVSQNGSSVERALARISEHKLLTEKVGSWRSNHSDWKSLSAFLSSKNTGRRIKKKKSTNTNTKMKIKDKIHADVDNLVKSHFNEEDELNLPLLIKDNSSVENIDAHYTPSSLSFSDNSNVTTYSSKLDEEDEQNIEIDEHEEVETHIEIVGEDELGLAKEDELGLAKEDELGYKEDELGLDNKDELGLNKEDELGLDKEDSDSDDMLSENDILDTKTVLNFDDNMTVMRLDLYNAIGESVDCSEPINVRVEEPIKSSRASCDIFFMSGATELSNTAPQNPSSEKIVDGHEDIIDFKTKLESSFLGRLSGKDKLNNKNYERNDHSRSSFQPKFRKSFQDKKKSYVKPANNVSAGRAKQQLRMEKFFQKKVTEESNQYKSSMRKSDPTGAQNSESKNSDVPMHPSWLASKKKKEQSTIAEFKGKKITFDD